MAEGTRFDTHVTAERFELLVNSVTDYAIYMLDADGYVSTWNPGARRFKGYEPEEIIGRHFSTFFTEEDRAAGVPAHALATAAREGRFEAEGWRVRKDGTRFWVNAVLDPIKDESGKVIGFAKITRDDTEKRQAQLALLESERRFRTLVQGVKDYALYMLDPDGRVSNWNTGAESIKGYKADEIVGQHFSRFYTEEDRAAGVPERALATALAEGKYEKEAWRVRKDGSRFYASVVIDPIHDEEGRLLGFAKITRDITERRKAHEELEEARAALFQSQKLQALGELTGGVAHDFNNLMTVIRGSAELLTRPGLSEEKRGRYLKAILDTADRAATLTSHLLAFGRRQALRPEVVNLNLRLDAFAEMAGRTLGGQFEVRLDLAPSLPPVEVDLAQLETALLNAAFNARDAMGEGGRLTLATRHLPGDGGGEVVVEIADTGSGMTAEVLERAFEPFFTTKPVGEGTGLGLSQIHGFAAQAGGRAEIRSAPGEGTAVRIILPVTQKAFGRSTAQARVEKPPRGLSVLLVEDNDHVREFAHHLLDELGYRVVSAASGEEALERLETETVDILFSDVVMPGLSGIELARLARQRDPDLPVLLASGYSEEIVGAAGADFEIVRKPYDLDGIEGALGTALQRSKAEA
ncbi:MAG TPA: PAS domain S-box protein [Allosphingosinicella sp.]|jgi:PAS domain S-box-containing protein|nr:PAS domain S-box protein [Allosphingosinicella sp.]